MIRLFLFLLLLPACSYYSSDLLAENEIAARWFAKQHNITGVYRVTCMSKFVASVCRVQWQQDDRPHEMELLCQREGSEVGAAHFCERVRDD